MLIRFGAFRFLDVGDLSGQPLLALVCPKDLIGPVDAYLVAHHGGADAAEPATFAAFKPRIAVMNNGAQKGGALEMYEYLHRVPGLEDVWQLHRSDAAGEQNFADGANRKPGRKHRALDQAECKRRRLVSRAEWSNGRLDELSGPMTGRDRPNANVRI